MSAVDPTKALLPFDLGDGEHRWSWVLRGAPSRGELPEGVANYVPTVRDILWLHACRGRPVVGWLDVTSGTRHRLANDDPEHLTVEPSVVCPSGCGDHGFVRDGRWVPA